jgi:hypothetical protein
MTRLPVPTPADCPVPFRHVVFFRGRLVPVTNMYDSEGVPVMDHRHAFRAVLYLGPEQWLPCRLRPTDIEPVEDLT